MWANTLKYQLGTMRVLVLIIFVSPVSFCHLVKYKSDSSLYWKLADYPQRPCRAEEGWIRCDSLQWCMQRAYGNQCPGINLHQCNDEELKFVNRQTSCVRRDEMHEFFDTKKYLPCHPDEYECRRSKKCIPREWVQDGTVDCSLWGNKDAWPTHSVYVDDSDEVNSLESCNNQTEYQCQGNKTRCIPRHLVMNGIPDCVNNEDEHISLKCDNETEFECAQNHRCIPRRYVNDGFGDCPNNTDEYNPSFTCNDRFEFSCNNTNEVKQCIPRAWVRNGVNDCSNEQDENATLPECYDNEFSCLDNKRCLSFKYLCDGIQNCADGSDEIELCSSPTMYRFSPSKPLIPWNFVHYYSNTILKLNYPGFYRNRDLVFGLKCKINFKTIKRKNNVISVFLQSVPQIYIINNISICYNNDDVCFGIDGTFDCARCLDGTIISKSQICDGMVDCKDLSDECSCEGSAMEELCENVFSFQISSQTRFSADTICNGKEDMLNGIDERYCKVFTNPRFNNHTNFKCTSQHSRSSSTSDGSEKFCDGHVDCPSMDDECSSDCLMKNLSNETVQRCFPSLERSDEVIPFTQYRRNFEYKTSYTKNGDERLIDSSNTSDCETALVLGDPFISGYGLLTSTHARCKGKYFRRKDMNFLCDISGINCPWMHNCGTNESKLIEVLKLCDHKNDCDDNSDEMNCSSQTHFYCRSGSPLYIESSKVADGRSDCSDRSDECRETAFSSASEMLKDSFFNVSVWICAILILATNFLVIVKHLRKIREFRCKSSISYCNTFLLINLSCSDMLFGVTLLVIGIKSQQFSGEYCEYDLEWRTSLTCNMVGILTVISSQTSMNLLVLMTGLRLYVTYNPFMTNQLNTIRLKLATFLSWMVSLFIASYPVWGSLNFVNYFYIKPNLFLNDQIVERSEMEFYVEKTKTIALRSNFSEVVTTVAHDSFITETLKSWIFNTETGTANFPNRHVDVKGSFGFYSSSSVCFPDLYSEHLLASHYSLFIVLYNLGCLIGITIGYCSIFYKVRKSGAKVQTSNDRANRQANKMMKRIFFIVTTDAICWFPLIAMSIYSYQGYELPEIAHPLSTLIFLPINSLINPIIYSRLNKPIKRTLTKLWGLIHCKCSSENKDQSPVEGIQMKIVSTTVSTITT